ncbi:MAG: shikimate kinase [Caldilinea sp. CFX5]|nr:shikimate kinase [Caldilinea sp. CFX5]
MATPSTVILIGPERAGKSTVGRLLAERLGLPFIDVGKDAAPYYAELGHSQEAVERAWEEGELEGYLHYQAPFEAHAVERILQEHPQGVFELKATQVAFSDSQLLARVQQALQPYQPIVLLLPAPEVETAVRLLDERGYVYYEGVELTEHFVRHHSNHDLAKLRLYTQGKTPQESCAELLAQLDPNSPEVFLIGPMGAGKSTLGKLLAEQLGRPQVSLDDIRWDYYKEIGYDKAVQREIREREGFAGVYRYWKRFEAHAVVRAVQEHHGCVMDFGAGHSVQENDADFARIQAVLAPYPNVVLLLPSPDLDEAVRLLREYTPFKIDGVPFTRYLVTHPAFRQIATQVVYTQEKTPEVICAEILGE